MLSFRFVPIPHDFIDYMMADLDPSAVTVLLCLAREAFRLSKNPGSYSMTLDQIASGGITRGKLPKSRGTGLSRSTVKRALSALIDTGLIAKEEHRKPDGMSLPNTYYVLFEDEGGEGSTSEPLGVHPRTGEGSTSEPGEESTHDPLLVEVSEKEIEEENTAPSLPPITESEKTEDEQAKIPDVEFTEFDDWVNDGGYLILGALRRERGLKITPKTRLSIREAVTMVPIRESLIEPVVSRFADWARKLGKPCDPASLVRGRWLKMLKGDEPLALGLDEDSTPVSRSSPELNRALNTILAPSFPRSAAPPSSGLPPLAERWNTIAPAHLKVEIWSSVGKVNANLQAALRDKGFTESLDKTLKWCQSVWEVGREDGYVTFSWFIKPGVYMEILNHGHDWLLRPEKAANGIAAAPSCDTSGGLER
jgi:hypothetical protein